MKNYLFGLKVNGLNAFQSIFFASFLMICLLILESNSYVRAEERINPHDFSKEELCTHCHIEGSSALSHDEITVCFRCHPDNLADHVIDVTPRKAFVPDGWYMSNDNKMVCYSCHDYHNRSGKERMLWVDYDKLCVLCHVRY